MPWSAPERGPSGGDIRGAWRILRFAFRVRRDPAPFCREVAGGVVHYLRSRDVDPRGLRVLDAGCGGGALAEVAAAAGARVVALDVADQRGPSIERTPFVMGRVERLPFADGAFDVALCSNVLEHVPDPWALIDELERVCRPGGHVWISWTNWLSPLGGHEMSPFHYLGATIGERAYRAVWRRAPRWNRPGQTLFVTHVGPTLRRLREGRFDVIDVAPRYWPSLRFLARIPGLRELAMWNCMVLLRRPEEQGVRAGRGAGAAASTGGTPPAR